MAEGQDRLDELINNALTSYGQAPVNDGLERRILARIAETGRPKGSVRALIMFAISAPVIVGVACLSWWIVPRAPSKLARPTVMISHKRILQPELPAVREQSLSPVLQTTTKRRILQIAATTPKLDRFPAPSFLTSDEQTLVALVEHSKNSFELSGFRGGPIEPIEITALEIKPLQSGLEH